MQDVIILEVWLTTDKITKLDDWTEVRRFDKLPRQEESPSLWRGVT
jgi:hypothetical protein